MNNFITALLFALSIFPKEKIDYKYCYTAKDYPIERLISQDFQYSNNLSSYSKNGYLWLEATIPGRIEDEKIEILSLGYEPIYEAVLYVQDKNYNWNQIGKTGTGVKINEKSMANFLYAFNFNGKKYRTINNKDIKIRIRINSKTDSIINLYSMKARVFRSNLNTLLSQRFFFLGACLIMIIYTCFTTITIKDKESFYMIAICFLLFLGTMIKSGVPVTYLFQYSPLPLILTKIGYFILCSFPILVCMELSNQLKQEFESLPGWVKKLESSLIYFYSVVITIGIIVNILPIPFSLTKYIGLISYSLCLAVSNLYTYIIFKYSSNYYASQLYSLNISLFILWLEILFKIFRFMPGATDILHIFDNKPTLSFSIAFFLSSISTLLFLNRKMRQKLAYLQIRTGEAEEKIEEEKKWRFIYNSLSDMVSNPIQSISNKLDKVKAFIPNEDFSSIKKSVAYTKTLTNVISLLSLYEHSPKEILFDSEPLNLNTLLLESISPELSTLRLNGCYPKLQETYIDSSYVYTNKALLAIALKFIIQTVLKQVHPKTTVTITSEYENFTFIFTVLFECDNISREQQEALLTLDFTEAEELAVNKLLEEWGIHLYIAKKIVSLLKGSLLFKPGINGSMIQMRLAIKPLSSQLKKSSVMEENYEDEKEETFILEEKPEYNQVIYIVEEDSVVRNEMYDNLKKSCFVKVFGNTQEFIKAVEANKPDMIIYSLSTPGTHILELLDSVNGLKHLPIMVTTKMVSKKMTDKLYEKGVFEVVQKPFDLYVIHHRIRAIIANRILYRELILSSITDSLRSSFLQDSSTSENQILPTNQFKQLKETEEEQLDTLPVENNSELIMNSIFISANLTKKECQIARLIVSGKSDKEISAELGISTGTVAVHNKNIYKKLNVHSRKELSEKLHKE